MADVRETSIDEYVPDPDNIRVHGPRNRQLIASSLKRHGFGRSILADKDGVIRAGNGTLEQAKAVGITRVIEVVSDGDAVIVHRRRDLEGDDATALAIEDNQAGLTSSWDPKRAVDQMRQLSEKGIRPADLGFLKSEHEALKRAAKQATQRPQPGQPPKKTAEKWLIVVECPGEAEHARTLDHLRAKGLKVRAFVS